MQMLYRLSYVGLVTRGEAEERCKVIRKGTQSTPKGCSNPVRTPPSGPAGEVSVPEENTVGVWICQAAGLRPSCVGRPSRNRALSGKRDSNPRPSAWKADALPTELFPLAARSETIKLLLINNLR